MPEPLSVEDRMTQLEELFSHHQQMLGDLSDVVLQLRADQERLKASFQEGLGRLESLVQDQLSPPDLDEKPPHY